MQWQHWQDIYWRNSQEVLLCKILINMIIFGWRNSQQVPNHHQAEISLHYNDNINDNKWVRNLQEVVESEELLCQVLQWWLWRSCLMMMMMTHRKQVFMTMMVVVKLMMTIYIYYRSCVWVLKNEYFLYSRDFVGSPVFRQFPFRGIWAFLLLPDTFGKGLKVGRSEGQKFRRLEGWKVEWMSVSRSQKWLFLKL